MSSTGILPKHQAAEEMSWVRLTASKVTSDLVAKRFSGGPSGGPDLDGDFAAVAFFWALSIDARISSFRVRFTLYKKKPHHVNHVFSAPRKGYVMSQQAELGSANYDMMEICRKRVPRKYV